MTYTLETFYTSKAWTKLRLQLMDERTNEDGVIICERCGKPILRRYDCIAHHKTELTQENVNDVEISMNPENIALIHMKCHNEEHERFGGLRQQVFIVHGAPCSGKNTFVQMNAHHDDLILDMDAIYRAVSLCEIHEKPKRLTPIAFDVRDAILEDIRIRKGVWRNAWVITTKTGLDLIREAERLGAQMVHVDTDEAECMVRLMEHPNGRDVKAWRGYIEDYFERAKMSG